MYIHCIQTLSSGSLSQTSTTMFRHNVHMFSVRQFDVRLKLDEPGRWVVRACQVIHIIILQVSNGALGLGCSQLPGFVSLVLGG